jgi:CDP-4-dehydro-6-deoxyglucose reductase
MAKPISDELTIEWGTEDARPKLFPPREDALFVVTDKRSVAERVVELRLRPVGQPIRYWPGQYVTLGNPRADIPARAYSISNAPRPDGELVLQVARADGGVTSNWIHDSWASARASRCPAPTAPSSATRRGHPGAVPRRRHRPRPILALTEAALRRGFRKPVTLLFSARSEADVYSQGLMAWWRTKHRASTTRSPSPAKPRRLPGRTRRCGAARALPDLSKHTVFAAGSPAFVDTCVATVRPSAQPGAHPHRRLLRPAATRGADADHLLTF